MNDLPIGVVGATGLVGQTMLQLLKDHPNVHAFAPARHLGEWVEGRPVKPMEDLDKTHLVVCLLATDAKVSKEIAPRLVERGCVVIDNSSCFRQESTVPLVVPEVNPEDIPDHPTVIANPNCSTIQAVVALCALKRWGIERVLYHTYQAVSGTGKGGLADYREGTATTLPHPIRDNVIPQIDFFCEDGYTKEETKMREETRKILHLPRLAVSATCMRVPVANGHTVAVSVWLKECPSPDQVREALAATCTVLDAPQRGVYPMPLTANGRDDVLVGRVRQDPDDPHIVHLITCADNLRKGAATNAVEILELLIKRLTLHE